MKKIGTLSLLFASLIMFAQKPPDSIVKSWKLKSHTMMGIGIHESLPKETQIEFISDGTWKSSALWQGAAQGKWSLESNNQKLFISSVPDEEKFTISHLTADELQLETRTFTAVYKITLAAMK